ncbi:MAG: DNA polymerase subunit beta [Promethearchaeota archaeon CR_4]|nr:MAG: DNA polymerase subunit beta [Candidatus Lokiarchaeota archaeon CR_4]
MVSKIQLLKQLKAELPNLAKDFHVKRIGLFGSYARGEQKNKSDIDLLVEFSEAPDFLEFIALEQYLSEKFEEKVDLVTPNALSPIIRTNIENDLVYA